MTSARQPWRFRAHARRLGIPGSVSGYLLGAIGEETAVPVMLRRAALIGAIQNLDPHGLAAQVRKLLSWDYRKRPGDYMRDPGKEPIHVHQEDVRAAILGHDAGPGCRTDGDWNAPPGAAQRYLDGHAVRAWAASPSQYGFTLPSYGASYDRCGRYVNRGCLEHADGRRGKTARWRCGRLSCPECYEHAIKLGAVRGTKRLVAGAVLRKSQLGPGRRQLIYHHYVVSVNPGRHDLLKTPEGVDRYRRKVYRQMEWLGYWGGATVYHPWRFEGRRMPFAPHFHVLAAGYVDRDRYLDMYGRRVMFGEMESHPIREVSRRTGGDVYAKVSHAGSAYEIYSILFYLLTHAGQRIPERSLDRGQAAGLADADGRNPDAGGSRPKTGRRNYGHAITYFGDVAPNKFAAKTVLSRGREGERDINRIVRSWQKKAEKRGLSAYASIQPVTCPPRGGAGRPGRSCGRLFDVDPRTAEYGAVESMPAAEAGKYLRGLFPGADNAPPAKSIGGGDRPDGPAPEPYRYAVVKLTYEKNGRIHVRSSYAVIALDPSTEHLCGECRGPLRVIVRVDGGGIPPPDDDHPEGVQGTYDDADDWTYYRPGGEHAGMGVPYYDNDGSQRWDTGVPNMPADAPRMPLEYHLRLQGWIDDHITRYATAAMRRQDPGVDREMAERAVRRHLARAGHPDKARDGWEEDLLDDIWGEYAAMADPMVGPPGQDTLDGDDPEDEGLSG